MTFGRALSILFSDEDWVRVHIKMNLTGARNLRGERQSGLTTTPPKPSKSPRFDFHHSQAYFWLIECGYRKKLVMTKLS